MRPCSDVKYVMCLIIISISSSHLFDRRGRMAQIPGWIAMNSMVCTCMEVQTLQQAFCTAEEGIYVSVLS